MMKILLALILVLAVMQSANALYIQVDGQTGGSLDVTGSAAVTVFCEDESSWLGYLIVEEGGSGILGEVVKLDAAGDLGAVSSYAEPGWGAGYELTAATSEAGVPVTAGPQFTLDFAGNLGVSAKVSLYLDPDYAVPVSSVYLNSVPEPATIALLGIGSLLLPRRR